jgi:peptidoglycan/xylan/chitin deacetylase (PgdA/CDA1 family)
MRSPSVTVQRTIIGGRAHGGLRLLLPLAAGLAAVIVALAFPPHLPAASANTPALPSPAPIASPAQQQAAIKRFLGYRLPVYCGGSERRLVALTFDDGPSLYTPQLLGLLKHADARATFFVIGSNLHSARLARYMRWETGLGALGDHTWTHPLLTSLTPAQITYQIAETMRQVSAATHTPVSLFRPPYDERDPTIDRIVHSLGLVTVLWDVDPRDWATTDWQAIGSRVLADLRPGAIVIMHETRPQTLTALKNVILPALRRDRLTAVSVPELLALDPPTLAHLRRGYAGCNH